MRVIELKRIKLTIGVWIVSLSSGLAWSASTPLPSPAADSGLKSFKQIVVRDLTLKKQVPITLLHPVGEVTVQGWVQDRIEVRVKKKVIAENQESANLLFNQVDLLTLETPRAFEMRMGVARGVDILSKLRAQKQNPVEVDLEIHAPYQLDLTLVLGRNQAFTVQQWRGSLTIDSRESSGHLNKLNLKGPLQVNCLGCGIELIESKVDGHILASTQAVVLRDVESRAFLVDVSTGEVKLENTKGNFSVHSDSGKLLSENHQGSLSFQSNAGGAFITAFKGKIEVQTESGQMIVEADEFDPFAHFDTVKGDIQVSLLPTFEGRLDLSSLKGEVVVQFPADPLHERSDEEYGPMVPGKVNAKVGSRTAPLIRAETKQGGIRILRRDPVSNLKQ